MRAAPRVHDIRPFPSEILRPNLALHSRSVRNSISSTTLSPFPAVAREFGCKILCPRREDFLSVSVSKQLCSAIEIGGL